MGSNVPRFNTAPVGVSGAAFLIDKKPALSIPRNQTAPSAGTASFAELSEIFARRAEADRARGEINAAEKEEKRVETLLRVKTTLAELTVDRHLSAAPVQRSGLPGRILTTIKEVATGKKADDGPPSRETEERKLLREFRKYAKSRAVSLPTFKKIFKLRGERFGEQLFRYLDRDNSGFVLDEEIVSVLVALEKGSFEESVAFLWSFITSDGNQITRDELKELIKASASEGNLSLSDDALESLATAFFTQAGVPDAPTLSQEQFKNALASHPELVISLKLGSLRAPSNVADKMKRACCGFGGQAGSLTWYEQFSTALSRMLRINDVQLACLLTVIVLAEIAGFIVGFLQNDHGPLFGVLGWSYPVAKGAARGVQVVLIAFPFTIARKLITALRPTVMAAVLPLDEHLKVHRHLACHFFFWGFVHSIAHFINGARIDDPSRYKVPASPPPPLGKLLNPQLANPLPPQPAPTALGPVNNWYAQETQVTGLLLLGIMVVGYMFVYFKIMHDRARRNRAAQWYQKLTRLVGNFEAFYFSHIGMAISVLVLLVIHPYPFIRETPHKSTTWLYMLPGVAVYLLELVVRNSVQWLWRTRVLDIKLHPGKVTELQLQVPRWAHKGWRGFTYRPGQYAFINVPAISPWEWHPFSLTSAPSDDFISFHIGAAGNWTTSLYELSSKVLDTPSPVLPPQPAAPRATDNPFSVSEEAAVDASVAKAEAMELAVPVPRNFFSVRVDGPFGAPAQDYSKHKTLLLVGAGIGATPFSSVLRQLVYEYNASKCWNCHKSNHKLFGVRKAYFYWTIREQRFPRAFQKTLEEVKAADLSDFLEINIHLTSSTADDFRTTMVRVANALQHEQQGKDAFMGIQSPLPTFFGRPVWSKVLAKVALENPDGDQVGVFVCGPAALSADLNAACNVYNTGSPKAMNPNRTQFLFHKEIF